MRNIFFRSILYFFVFFCCSRASDNGYEYSSIVSVPDLSFFNHVYTGLDILEQMDFDLLQDKNIGIFCNHTAVTRNNKHLLDMLSNVDNIRVEAIFEPEFGIWGMDDKRAKLIGNDRIDPVSGAKVFNLLDRSLYPPDWIMKKLDMIVIDIQDTGVRYTTFISSITKLFESASEHEIPVIVLDRPNPLGGLKIDGPLPREEYQSFEAYHLVPIRHGMTIGELLLMGDNVGLGYYNDEVRSLKSFVQNPLHSKYKQIAYRTGDLVRFCSTDNKIYFDFCLFNIVIFCVNYHLILQEYNKV